MVSGAKLVKLLKEHGTGKDKLDICRRALFEAKAERRHATAEEVVAALADKLGPFHGTVKKARVIAETGNWEAPKPPEFSNVEDELHAIEMQSAMESKDSKKAK